MESLRQRLLQIKDALGGRQILALLVIFFTMLAVPLTVYLVQQRQNARPKAASGDVTLAIIPAGRTNLTANAPFSVDLYVDVGQAQGASRITGIDLNMTLTNDAGATMTGFNADDSASKLSTAIINDVGSGSGFRYVAVNPDPAVPTNSYVHLGKLNLQAGSSGTSTLSISRVEMVASGRTDVVSQPANLPTATFTVPGVPTPTLTPTPGPGRMPGDADDNKCINPDDYTIWKQELNGGRSTKCASWTVENPPVVDTEDYGIWYRAWIVRSNRESCTTPLAGRCLDLR